MKKFLKITGISILIILLLLFIIPFLFKGKIIALAKKEINAMITARADFSDASLSLFRNFPRVSLSLENLHITDVEGFPGDTLVAADNIAVALDLISVIRGTNINVHRVTIENPRIHALVNSAGQANWDIMRADSSSQDTDTTASEFNMELKEYALQNAYIYYEDSVAGIKSEISGLDHRGSGDFTASRFILNTATTAESVSFYYGPVPYLSGVRVKADADIDVDNDQEKYSFKTDEISINDLKISTEGFYQFVSDTVDAMDIRFNAPSTDFKHLLSLIPAIYQKDFEQVETRGTAKFEGFVRGDLTETRIPAYNIQLNVNDGFFQYPDLPAPMKNIRLDVDINNPDGITDHTVVNIPAGHFEIENDPFDFRLLVRNPVTAMFVDAAAKGRLDLSKISRMVKLEANTRLSGLLQADVAVKGNVEAMQQQQLDRFTANGTVSLNDFLYASNDYPDGVSLSNLLMTFNPSNVTLNNAAGSYMDTRFEANGTINNLLAYALKNHPLNGVVNVSADKVNINKFLSDDTAEDTTTSASQPFLVPANIDLTLNARADEVLYDNLVISGLNGSLKLSDQTLRLDNIRGEALDGAINISGTYSTKVDKKHPAITLLYNVQNVDVQKTFNTFVTVQKLMPLGKWLGGKLNSQLSVSGKLGESMMPDISTLTGEGNLLLIEGFLQKFGPLEKLGERLQINELKEITLREVRQYFEFTNGKVFVKPFKINYKNINMEIGGMHGIDQSLDYSINLQVPRSMLGTNANNVVNDLAAKASAGGIPVKLSEVVNIRAKMKGTLTNPDIQLDLRETASNMTEEIKDQLKEFAQSKVDSVRKAVSDTVQSIKKEVIQGAAEKLKEELFKRRDSTAKKDTTTSSPADKAKESARGLLKSIIPQKKERDSTRQ